MTGARPLRRALEQMVEGPLSERILSKEFRTGDTIIVDVDNGELTFGVMSALRAGAARAGRCPQPRLAGPGPRAALMVGASRGADLLVLGIWLGGCVRAAQGV